jgi:hypothetical protein
MIRVALPALAAALLAGCATTTPAVPSTPPAEITYETGPCFGACPVYSVTVGNSGRPGVFDGKRFTKVTGTREFALQPADFNRFAVALADARAADQRAYEQGGANCKAMVTDMPSVSVTFREGSAAPRTFRFYYGCRDPQNAKLAEALRRAPELLPIAAFIGKR